MRAVVLVPRRADGGRRDELWAWVAHRWATKHADLEVFEGHHDDGPFNRSAAINRAADAAGAWDVAVIADSDSFVSTEAIHEAVSLCAASGRMVLAYDQFAYLSRAMSDRVMAGYDGNWWTGVEWAMPGTCSSMVLVDRPLWDRAEGFDEGFVGWGGEDVAFSHKAQTFGGGLSRVAGPVWHLWHPPAVHANAEAWAPRIGRYAEASYNPARMADLIEELRP